MSDHDAPQWVITIPEQVIHDAPESLITIRRNR